MAQLLPLFGSHYGIHRIGITEVRHDPTLQPPRRWVPVPTNTLTFTSISSAIHIGLQILETPQGLQALHRVGERVVDEWASLNQFQFGGNPANMRGYVNHFLSALRQDFPLINIAELEEGIGLLAETRRMPGNIWDGNLAQYRPKDAIGITFNYSRIADMVAAADESLRSNINPAVRRAMANRHKYFQFLFAATTAHELCHAFIAYLAQNSQDPTSYTPPRISVPGFVAADIVGRPLFGESGRYFEVLLFGGAIIYFRDPRDGHGQTGVPHVVDAAGNARRISTNAIFRLVEDRVFTFPLPTTGNTSTPHQRAASGISQIGENQTGAPYPSGRTFFMNPPPGSFTLYDVSHQELRRVPVDPRPLREAIRVR